jgi:2-methylcitrate dehydratase PrpD
MTRVSLSQHQATDAVVDFAAGLALDDIPAAVLSRAVDDLTDTVGVLLGGSTEPAARRVRGYLREAGQSPGPVQLLGEAGTATRSGAALWHGVAIHALDYDDTGHPGNVHPSSHVLPALWSLAAGHPVDGASFLLAYLIGLEVENKIGACLPARRRNLRLHPTGVIGPVAAAAAGARLLGLSADQLRMALGAAGSMGAGLRANVGSDVKPLHAGRAAASAVEAVLLASNGLLACPAILDVPYGFFDAFRGGDGDFAGFDTSPLGALGHVWDLDTEFGIALKPFPCCACTHPAIEAALELGAKVDTADIAAVDIGTSAYAMSIVGDPAPDTATQARFSVQYCVAAALARHHVGLSSFTGAAVADPDVRRLMALVSVHVDETLRDDPEHPAVVTVTRRDGERISEAVPFASGKPARWFTPDQLFAKFSDCAGGVLEPDGIAALFAWTQALRAQADVGEIAALARPAAAG